jgi:hypothetical protein
MALKSIILTLLLLLSLTRPAAGQIPEPALERSPELRRLEGMWQRGEYEEVFRKLADYRDDPKHRSAGVDYMIATSACRTNGRQSDGRKYFNWILKHYVLNKADRKIIEAERNACSQRKPPARPPMLTTPTQFGALYYIDKPGPFTKANTGRSSAAISYKTSDDGETEPEDGEMEPEDDETDSGVDEERGVPPPLPLEEFSARLIKQDERYLAAHRVGATLAGAVKAMEEAGWRRSQLRYRVQTTEHFVLASFSGHTRAQLTAIGQDLERYLEYYMSRYDMPPPLYLISVYLIPGDWLLYDFARNIHSVNVSTGTIGYSFPADQSIMALIPRMIYGTLKHELFHLMVRNNFGDIPPWLEEGMATLYEASRVTPEGIVGVPSWRARALREPGRRWPRIRELVAMDWQTFLVDPYAEGFYDEEKDFDWWKEMRVGRSQELNHSVARYFALYLQEKGKLAEVYRAFREMKVNDDPDGETVKILESILQQPLDVVETDFVSWFKRVDGFLQTPKRRGRLRKH